jgi:hypothetical protein
MTAAFDIQVEPAPAQLGEDYIMLARCTCPSRTGSIRILVSGELLLDADPVTVREVIARECRLAVNEPELQVLSARAILVGEPG